MQSTAAQGPVNCLPTVAGYVLGFLFAVAAGPILLPDLHGRGLTLAVGLLAACVAGLRLHLRWVIFTLLSPARSRAVLTRVDAGSVLLLVCSVLLRLAAGSGGNKLEQDLLCLLAVAALLGSLIMMRQARHIWFASSFVSQQVDAAGSQAFDEA
jgi:hypothetical protein